MIIIDGHKLTVPEEGEGFAIREIMDDYIIHVIQRKVWEPETTKIVKEQVKEGSICVDVGASIGYFTLLFASLGAKVYSIEPTGNQFKYLKKNVELNGYNDKVVLLNIAAWDKQEAIRNTIIRVNKGVFPVIDGYPLDAFIASKVDFIKIDVDGSEPRVLKGLIKTIEKTPQLKMVIEYYPQLIEELGNNPADMMDILNKYFKYEKIEGDLDGDKYWNYYCERK